MKQCVMVAGLAFGDEGKGTMVDYFVRDREATLTVRYNGGPQAAHNVVDKARHHTFAQLGSGTFAGARTHLSRFCLFEPFSLENEAEALWDEGGPDDPFKLFSVDPRCVVITPYHWLANRIRESLRGLQRHGSTGFGVGEARKDSLEHRPTLRVQDIVSGQGKAILDAIYQAKIQELAVPSGCSEEVYSLLCAMADFYNSGTLADHYHEVMQGKHVYRTENVLREHQSVVFEGAQGVLLDETFGFAPYNTWTDTTFHNADRLVTEADGPWAKEKVGVVRTYFTRHGPGPFPTEEPCINAVEKYNKTGNWAGAFRVGHLDLNMVHYAISVCGVDRLAMTHCDTYPSSQVAVSYVCQAQAVLTSSGRWPTDSLLKVKPVYQSVSDITSLCDLVEQRVHKPVSYLSFGPTAEDKSCLYRATMVGSDGL